MYVNNLIEGSHQQKRLTYTAEELEYLYFVHALNIVGRILMYKQGIKLFPIKVRGFDGMLYRIIILNRY